ncbi:MAG: hypothetical protein AAFP97_00860 [Pseudomonadota bacterium]
MESLFNLKCHRLRRIPDKEITWHQCGALVSKTHRLASRQNELDRKIILFTISDDTCRPLALTRIANTFNDSHIANVRADGIR